MRQKELRIALVCYGGVSLAVYMHGVTKELWKLARASRQFHGGAGELTPSEAIYRELLETVQDKGLRLRVLPDILAGASAGGINAVFLAQAIHSGQSLEPLTDLWLDHADVEQLIDEEARPWSRATKFWAQPLVTWLFTRPGNAVSDSVAPETRAEVRRKLSTLIRSRWFAPPFSGLGFSDLLAGALVAMRGAPAGDPLLPPGHPLDLFVTATDFHGARQLLRLHSPPVVEEREHRMPIGFHKRTPSGPGAALAHPLELVMAARSTASFPGAFPPLEIAELDRLAAKRDWEWSGRDAFLRHIMPGHFADRDVEKVTLIDGSVLVNKPFAEAMGVLDMRPAQREVDRRFVYIDPHPKTVAITDDNRTTGFFRTILGSLSAIPRQQPIRDNLEALQEQSREAERMRRIIASLRPEVEGAVDRLFGRTLFLDRPTTKRLKAWREKAQQVAAEGAGYAFVSYAESKFAGIVDRLAESIAAAAPEEERPDVAALSARLRSALAGAQVDRLATDGGGASVEAIEFFRSHDLGFRVRRLRLLARRLARDWEADPEISDEALDTARDAVYRMLSLYFEAEKRPAGDPYFAPLAAGALEAPLAALGALAERRRLKQCDEQVEEMLATTLEEMPKNLRRRMLLTYLGFPFYDVATLPLIKNEALTEFEPVKVDRISPEDAKSIREGGTAETLRGTEFFNFGAFFSRAYRENDYLWGRLHGADRMIDLVASTMDHRLPDAAFHDFKRRMFMAILAEEEPRLTAELRLVPGLMHEVQVKLG
ncbi:patatin-like protein [Alteriqipengyuania flavescens]|uniref:patatin-like protein n=1 Tax=Alteriqipengyuania flavescens TaxID=3053610 RepID=UPI0025B475FF|nr:patatin-like protein [Alteriqipengyuania flavescens]WJY20082.1 patatin-like protein [Alteriqipengyuania flavescens]WJY26025.1 patatin-like protein [Alteriqipengyuania flavescens]